MILVSARLDALLLFCDLCQLLTFIKDCGNGQSLCCQLSAQEPSQNLSPIREAPFKIILEVFGHCPNSFCNPSPPPHSNGHSEALRLRKKCPKPSRQGSRPPQNEGNSSKKSCPKPSGQGFRPPPPKRAMPKCLG